MTKIFISYSWDSPEHKDWVFFEIAEKLRGDGLECVSDHHVGFQEQRWTNWMEDQGLRTKFFWTRAVKISDSLSFGKQRIRDVYTTG